MRQYLSFALLATAMCLLGSPSIGAVAVAMLLLLPSAILKKSAGAAYGVVVTIIAGLVCLADIFCQEYFFSTLNANLLGLVRNTDAQEARNFMAAFCHLSLLGRWRITAGLVLLLGAPFAARVKLPKLLLGPMLLLGIIGLWHIDNTPPGRFASSLSQSIRQERQHAQRLEAYHTWKADSCAFSSPRIVLVIGESFNRHHASAYGYTLPTTPFQDARRSSGSLVLFTDVVSPWNITTRAFGQMFSVPFPAILRRAGYTVNFYSNQNPDVTGLRKLTGGTFIFSDKQLSEVSFSFRNTASAYFDHDFVEKVLPPSLPPVPVLDIIHLKGQHFEYEDHYPPSFAYFTLADYPAGTPDAVMHYDNATRYNDYVLELILQRYAGTDAVVVFVSDHGEEVFDELPLSGRSHNTPGRAEARAEYEVPMWIWCSSEYAREHPSVALSIQEAARRPFYTADISHLILSLAGATGHFTSPERDVLSPSYKCPRRIIADAVDYDSL